MRVRQQGQDGFVKNRYFIPGARSYALAGAIEFHTNSTLALTIDSNQDVHIDGDLYVNGDGTNVPVHSYWQRVQAQAAVGLEIGHLRTNADGHVHI